MLAVARARSSTPFWPAACAPPRSTRSSTTTSTTPSISAQRGLRRRRVRRGAVGFGRLIWAVGKSAIRGRGGCIPDLLAAAERDMPPGFFSLEALRAVPATRVRISWNGQPLLASADGRCDHASISTPRSASSSRRRPARCADSRRAPHRLPFRILRSVCDGGPGYVDAVSGSAAHADLAAEAGAEVVFVVNPLCRTSTTAVSRCEPAACTRSGEGRADLQPEPLELASRCCRPNIHRRRSSCCSRRARPTCCSAPRWASRRAARPFGTATSRRRSGWPSRERPSSDVSRWPSLNPRDRPAARRGR